VAIFIFSVAGVFLYAGFETATLAVNRKMLAERLRGRSQQADHVFGLITDTQRALAVALLGMNACSLTGALALFALLQRLLPAGLGRTARAAWALGLALAVAVPLFVLVADVLARPLVRRRAVEFVMTLNRPLRWSVALLWPVLHGCSTAAGWLLRPFGVGRAPAKRPMKVGEIYAMLGQAGEKRGLHEAEREMIESAIDLQATKAREVMRPLVDVIALKIPETTVAGALETARATGYSRFPVFRRRIIEMTHYVDIPSLLIAGVREGPLEPHARPALIVPETMIVGDLLREFTDKGEHCAIVVDEFGGVAGWVTREDVLKEIVGDIADKGADEAPRWTRDSEGVFHVQARMDLDDLNWEIESRLVKGDDYDTLGGWLYARLGRVPVPGDSIEDDGARVTVEQMDGHRILQASVRLLESDDKA